MTTTTGERLNKLLDHSGFKRGRGRIPEFQMYLVNKKIPEFETLKYSTVRSWFDDHAPPMKKISLIVDQLHKDFVLQIDIEQLKIWWKLGGISPFPASLDNSYEGEVEKKLRFLITSIVTEQCGRDFEKLPSSTLVDIKEKAIGLAKDFANTEKVDIPIEFLKIFIKEQIRKTVIGSKME